MQRILDSVLLVSEAEIKDAMRFLAMRMKIVVEPSGAVSAAAVLNRKLPGEVKRIGVVLSGGNVDAALLAEVLAEG